MVFDPDAPRKFVAVRVTSYDDTGNAVEGKTME
jgi:hypothetical protein